MASYDNEGKRIKRMKLFGNVIEQEERIIADIHISVYTSTEVGESSTSAKPVINNDSRLTKAESNTALNLTLYSSMEIGESSASAKPVNNNDIQLTKTESGNTGNAISNGEVIQVKQGINPKNFKLFGKDIADFVPYSSTEKGESSTSANPIINNSGPLSKVETSTVNAIGSSDINSADKRAERSTSANPVTNSYGPIAEIQSITVNAIGNGNDIVSNNINSADDLSAVSSNNSSVNNANTDKKPRKTLTKEPKRVPKKQRNPKPSKEEINRANIDPPGLPDGFKQQVKDMGGNEEPTLVTQKYLYRSDVNETQKRFKIDKQVIKGQEFFSEEEKKVMEENGEMKVPLILQRHDTKDFERADLWLSKWTSKPKILDDGKEIQGKSCYVLQRGWTEARKSIGLEVSGYVVQLWSFRYGDQKKLGFVMLKLDV